MERIYLVRFSKVVFADIQRIFNIMIIRVPDDIDYHYAKPLFTKDGPEGIWYEVTDFEIRDKKHNALGVFRIKEFSDAMTISFYITNTQHRQEFIEFIQSTIEEMNLVGFTILHAEGFSEDTINLEIQEKQNIPTKESNDEKSDDDMSNSHMSDATSEDITEQEGKPWEQIDEKENLKEMVRLLHEGHSLAYIAEKTSYSINTVYKRTSEMRGKYGVEVVPFSQAWRNSED